MTEIDSHAWGWNAYGLQQSAGQLELRAVKEFVRRRYAENKEFVPAEEVYEIVISYCKWYRQENKRYRELLDDHLKFCANPVFYPSLDLLKCPPSDKK